MKFFLPHTSRGEADATYRKMARALAMQFRLTLVERRIYSISYRNSNKARKLEVGKIEQEHGIYEVMAIFESKTYIVLTRAPDGSDGVTIMVGKQEVEEIEEFDAAPVPVAATVLQPESHTP
jgi:hypothetical protein